MPGIADRHYRVFSYDGKEHELQQVVEDRAADIFGPFRFFISKKRLVSKKAEVEAIPDGFLLDVSDPDNPSRRFRSSLQCR